MHWFSPKCLPEGKERSQQVALTNRGHLVPCCFIDQKEDLRHPTMFKMLKVSKVSDYDDVKDIFKTKEWQEFAKNLAEKNMDKVMPVCKKHCKIRDSKNRLRKENYIYKGVNKEIQNEKRGTTQILSSTAQMEEERELRTFLGEPDEKKTNS